MTIYLYTGFPESVKKDWYDVFFPELAINDNGDTYLLHGSLIANALDQHIKNFILEKNWSIEYDLPISIFTNSEHVLNALRLCVIRKTHGDLQVFIKFNDGNDERIPITIDEKGNLREWPIGMFDQQEKDLATIFKLNRKV